MIVEKYKFLNFPLYRYNKEQFLQVLDSLSKELTVLVFDVFENSYIYNDDAILVYELQEQLRRRNLKHFIILDGSYDNHQIEINNNILFFNWSLIFTYWNLFVLNHPYVPKYQPSSNLGLFLTGKPNKQHRVGLLKKFYERKKLDTLIWSFNVHESIKNSIREDFFSNYSLESFDTFIKECSKNLDIEYTNPTFVHLGFPYDHTLYNKTGFSLISETKIDGFTDRPLITEKTWRTISNHHPFIMLGPSHNLRWLKDKGFRTFEEYIPVRYNDIWDIDKRMDSIVTSSVYLSKNIISKNKLLLEQDTAHNFRVFKQMGKENMDKFLLPLSESVDFIKSVVDFHVYGHRNLLICHN